MNKKLIIAGFLSTGVATMAAFAAPGLVAAQANVNVEDAFVQKLAVKLGIDEEAVQTAVQSTREEIRSEKDAELEAEINTAVSEGKITQRQADILTAMLDYRPETPQNTERPADFDSLTKEERQAAMEARRTEMQQSQLNALNEAGLNTSLDELQSAQEAARDAGIRFGFGGMHKGPGRIM